VPDRRLAVPLLIAALATVLAAPAHAQALSCEVPAVIPKPRPVGPDANDPVRQIPVGGYTLALTWTPQFCREHSGDRSFQCDRSARFGFTLHGLWPDGRNRAWPQYCRPATIIPEPVLRENLCMVPSVDLMQHEWAKHGTCMASDPARYFARARPLYQSLRFPDMNALSRQPDLTVDGFARAFAAANRHIPGLSTDAVRVRVTRDLWLSEVWLCLDQDLAFARCGRNQGGGFARAYRLKIWRGR